MRIFINIVIVFFFIMGIGSNVCSNEPRQYLALTIKADKNVYKADDKIVITGKLTNISNEEVILYKNGEPDEINISIEPTDKKAKPMTGSGGFQAADYYHPKTIVLKPAQFINVKKTVSVDYELIKTNITCIEWKKREKPYKNSNRMCIKESYDTDERFTISLEDDRFKTALALSDTGYTLQATYKADQTIEMFFKLKPETVNQFSSNDLRQGKKIKSNKVKIKFMK